MPSLRHARSHFANATCSSRLSKAPGEQAQRAVRTEAPERGRSRGSDRSSVKVSATNTSNLVVKQAPLASNANSVIGFLGSSPQSLNEVSLLVLLDTPDILALLSDTNRSPADSAQGATPHTVQGMEFCDRAKVHHSAVTKPCDAHET